MASPMFCNPQKHQRRESRGNGRSPGALNMAAAGDNKLVLLSSVGSDFSCGVYFICRITNDRKRGSNTMEGSALVRPPQSRFRIWLTPDETDSSISELLSLPPEDSDSYGIELENPHESFCNLHNKVQVHSINVFRNKHQKPKSIKYVPLEIKKKETADADVIQEHRAALRRIAKECSKIRPSEEPSRGQISSKEPHCFNIKEKVCSADLITRGKIGVEPRNLENQQAKV
ncbi:Chromodomain Y-like protein [Fukomys damarensis]|uniref:Chromodomain Y-like protein n=1 Tax=Fukomys damarensis TaxID=885580 RepID=A0A091E3M5_FUKDA|nr:Chromodomain Y-like protein [Fukomys damarensis]